MCDLIYGLAGIMLYGLGGAVMAGYYTRKDWWVGDDQDVGLAVFGVGAWPAALALIVVWRLLVKPTLPIYRGIYRLAAGKTFFP